MADIVQTTEYGLAMPNGQVHWGSYLNRSLNTEQDRAEMLAALRRTAAEVGFDEVEFLSHYGWTSRTVTYHHDKKFVIDHADVVGASESGG